MTASEAIRTVWEAVTSEAGQREGYFYRRLKQPCVNASYAGIVQPSGARRLSLEFAARDFSSQPLPEDSRGFSSTIGELPGEPTGMVCLHLTEASPAFSSMFELLCVDALDQWNAKQSRIEAVKAVLQRLKLWRRFFQCQPGLSREEYVGLFAELTVLGELLQSGLNPEYAVDGWSGPLGSNQDFMFGPIAMEVKASTGNDLDRVIVANELQLDTSGLSGLLLVHIAYDFRKDAGQTLAQKVLEVAGLLDDSRAIVVFEERLLAAGYMRDMRSPWSTYGLTKRKRAAYRIEGDFPRITRAQLSPGLSRVSYYLNLAACRTWEMLFENAISTVMGAEVDA